MITEKQLWEVNQLIKKRNKLRTLLSRLDSPHVETTVGLVTINSASKERVSGLSDEAEDFHREFPEAEKKLKEQVRIMLENRVSELNQEIAKYVKE